MDKGSYDMKGYLKKLKSSSFARLFGNTNTRWFEINFREKTIMYKESKEASQAKEIHHFTEITDFLDKVSADDRKQCDWMFGFQVWLREKKYILFSLTQFELNKWSNAFNIILKRKPVERRSNSTLLNTSISDINNILAKNRTSVFPPTARDTSMNSTLRSTDNVRRDNSNIEKSKSVINNAPQSKAPAIEPSSLKRDEKPVENEGKTEKEEKLKKLKDKMKIPKNKEKVEVKILDDFEDNIIADEDLPKINLNRLETVKDEKEEKVVIKDDIEDWDYYDKHNKKTNLEGVSNIVKSVDLNKSINNGLNSSMVKADVDINQYRNSLVLENLNLQNNSVILNNLSIERENNNNSIFFDNSVEEDIQQKPKVKNMKKDDLKSQITFDKQDKLNLIKDKEKNKNKVVPSNDQNAIIIKTHDRKESESPKSKMSRYDPSEEYKIHEKPSLSIDNNKKMFAEKPFPNIPVEINQSLSGKSTNNQSNQSRVKEQKDSNDVFHSKFNFDFESSQSLEKEPINTKPQKEISVNDTFQFKKEVPLLNQEKSNAPSKAINEVNFDFGVEKQTNAKKPSEKRGTLAVMNNREKESNVVNIKLGGQNNEAVEKSRKSVDLINKPKYNENNESLVNLILKKTIKNSENNVKPINQSFNYEKDLNVSMTKNEVISQSMMRENMEDINRMLFGNSSMGNLNNSIGNDTRKQPDTFESSSIIKGKKDKKLFQEDFEDFSMFPSEVPNKSITESKQVPEKKKVSEKKLPVTTQISAKNYFNAVEIPLPQGNKLSFEEPLTQSNEIILKRPNEKSKEENDIKYVKKDKVQEVYPKQKSSEKSKKTVVPNAEENDDEFEKILKKKSTVESSRKKQEQNGNKYIKAKFTDYFDNKLNNSANDNYMDINNLSFSESSNLGLNHSFNNNIHKENSFYNENSFRNVNENSIFGREHFFGDEFAMNNSIENSDTVKKEEELFTLKVENKEMGKVKETKKEEIVKNSVEKKVNNKNENKISGFNDSFDNDEWK